MNENVFKFTAAVMNTPRSGCGEPGTESPTPNSSPNHEISYMNKLSI